MANTPRQRSKYAPKPKPTDECQCTRATAAKPFGEVTHQFPYTNEEGVRLFSRFRYRITDPASNEGDKTFRYCPHYDRTNPVHVSLPYGLQRIKEAIQLSLANPRHRYYLVEGCPDCEATWALADEYATTTHLGTRFPLEVAEHFRGYQGTVFIVVDRDHLDPEHKARFEHEDESKRRDYPGSASALRRRRALRAVGVKCFFREARKGKDMRDHLEAGYSPDDLRKITLDQVKARAPREAENSRSATLQLSQADLPEGPAMQRFIAALEAKGFFLEKIGPTRYKTNCPHPDHDDHNPSFEFEQGDKGVVATCESGQCNYGKDGLKQICEYLGIKQSAMFDSTKAKAPKPTDREYCPDSSDPMEVARHIEDEFLSDTGEIIVYHWNDNFWIYNGRHFVNTPKDAIKSKLYKRMDTEFSLKLSGDNWIPVRWSPTSGKISNLMDAVEGMYELDHTIRPGTWLYQQHTDGACVPMGNGILQIKDRKLVESSASYFNTWSVPYAYDPEAECPNWDRFIGQVFGDDPESARLLQQWFGYIISGRTDMQKMLLMTGPPRGGRGTIGRILKALVGDESHVGLTLSSLATDFGLHKLVSKSVAVIGDSRTALRQGESQIVVERLLSISGEDELPINRKGKDEISLTLGTRIMAFSNELLGFRDSSNAITDRWMVIQMTKSFGGVEDTKLFSKLADELPGIFNWALDGLDDLDDMGRFIQPESAKESLQNMNESASPEKEFIEDCCTIGVDEWCFINELWILWQSKAEFDKRKPGNRNHLPSRLSPIVQRLGGRLTNDRMTIDGVRHRIFRGLSINEDKPGPTTKSDNGNTTTFGGK